MECQRRCGCQISLEYIHVEYSSKLFNIYHPVNFSKNLLTVPNRSCGFSLRLILAVNFNLFLSCVKLG